jgi:hypothetical protein
MTRAEHVEWAKQRAREYLDAGDWRNAWASFASDMGKHEETADHPALLLGMQLLMAGHNRTVAGMREFIEGFN